MMSGIRGQRDQTQIPLEAARTRPSRSLECSADCWVRVQAKGEVPCRAVGLLEEAVGGRSRPVTGGQVLMNTRQDQAPCGEASRNGS